MPSFPSIRRSLTSSHCLLCYLSRCVWPGDHKSLISPARCCSGRRMNPETVCSRSLLVSVHTRCTLLMDSPCPGSKECFQTAPTTISVVRNPFLSVYRVSTRHGPHFNGVFTENMRQPSTKCIWTDGVAFLAPTRVIYVHDFII